MRAALLLVLVAALTVVAAEPKDDKVKDDKVKETLKKLEGTWVVESAVDSGEGIGSELNWEWVFDGNKITRQNPNGGETQEFTFKIDPTVSPKAFDLTWPKEKFTLSCIYEIKDDTLRICMSKLKPDERPTKFTDTDVGYCLTVLKRPKP